MGLDVRAAKEPMLRMRPFLLLEKPAQLVKGAEYRTMQPYFESILGSTIFVTRMVASTLISTTFSISLSGHSWKSTGIE